jgi:hypothetical protein
VKGCEKNAEAKPISHDGSPVVSAIGARSIATVAPLSVRYPQGIRRLKSQAGACRVNRAAVCGRHA